jgi:hypothetical protein
LSVSCSDWGRVTSSGSSWDWSGKWSWGSKVGVVEVGMVWWVWEMSKTGFGSGSITGGGIWSSGSWVGVVMWDICWLSLEAWGTGWSILWSIGSGTRWGNAVDSKRSVVSVTFWEVLSGSVSLLWGNIVLGGDGTKGKEVSIGSEFHIYNLLIL